tara:strand:+ start:2187 stop:2417 length:231 start_codon:yes stop_codon:yes gene_type:complete
MSNRIKRINRIKGTMVKQMPKSGRDIRRETLREWGWDGQRRLRMTGGAFGKEPRQMAEARRLKDLPMARALAGLSR